MADHSHNKIERRKIIVIASLGYSLVNFRLELLKRMVANGHEVLALAPEIEPRTKKILDTFGIKTASFPMARTGTNPFQDIRTIFALRKIFLSFKPDYILPYTAKPIMYGNLAGRMTKVPHRFSLFTGLGDSFSEANPTGKRELTRKISILLYRLSSKGLEGAFTYNPVETEDIRNFGLIPASTPITAVPGSGVDTSLFTNSTPDNDPVCFLMIARLLKSKGTHIFAQASQRLKAKGLNFEARLLGPTDLNPDAISQEQLDEWIDEGTLQYLGSTDDVRPHLEKCCVMVLPSMYREGIPRSVLEAMSSGRAVITTDVPGCAHSIRDQKDGFIVKTGDVDALEEAMEKFIKNPKLIAQMGASGREHACRTFDVHKVNKLLLTTMGLE
jgi:glycosyltransferase involved in cell wall biosynthesis